jgi:hypothetical protein
LAAGSQVSYFDHHFSGDIPKHDNLVHYIDTKANTCTSLIVNKYLQSAFPEWAIVGAYGDNMHREANALSDTLLLTKDQKQQLQELGTYLNYNAYGGTLDDLHIHPGQLYRDLSSYGSPFYFIEQNPSLYETLQKGYERDMACAQEIEPQLANESLALLIFPDQAWARRTSGVYANDLANQFPDRAHAILTEKGDAYLVSVRAPMNRRRGADELCMKFPGGGGRKAAAGIHFLAESSYESFIEEFKKMYQS